MNENPVIILDFYNMKPTIKCKHCQKEFMPARYGVQKFCSVSCRVSNWQMNKRLNSIQNSKPKNELSTPGLSIPITPENSTKSLLAAGLVNMGAIAMNETAKRIGVFESKETKQLEEANKKLDEMKLKLDRVEQAVKIKKANISFKDSL